MSLRCDEDKCHKPTIVATVPTTRATVLETLSHEHVGVLQELAPGQWPMLLHDAQSPAAQSHSHLCDLVESCTRSCDCTIYTCPNQQNTLHATNVTISAGGRLAGPTKVAALDHS